MTSHADERPFSQLLGDMLTQLSTLIQNEVDVARAELREKLSIVGGAMRLIAVPILPIPDDRSESVQKSVLCPTENVCEVNGA